MPPSGGPTVAPPGTAGTPDPDNPRHYRQKHSGPGPGSPPRGRPPKRGEAPAPWGGGGKQVDSRRRGRSRPVRPDEGRQPPPVSAVYWQNGPPTPLPGASGFWSWTRSLGGFERWSR